MIIAILVLSIIDFVSVAIGSYIEKGTTAINLPVLVIIVLAIIMLATNIH